MKRFKRFLKKLLKHSPMVLATIVSIGTWALFLWMLFGYMLETAAFHAAMKIYAG